MQLRSFVLADTVALTPDGKAMIVGAGVGQVNAFRFPWALPQLAAYVTVEADPEEVGSPHEFDAQIIDFDERPVSAVSGPFTIPNQGDQQSLMVNFAPAFLQVQFERPGRYWVRVLADRRELGRFPLDVVEVPEPTQQGWVSSAAQSSSG